MDGNGVYQALKRFLLQSCKLTFRASGDPVAGILKIEQEKQDGLKKLRQDNGTSTFHDAWSDMFKQIENSGRDFARSISSDIGDAIQALNGQLTQLIVTGKGLNFKQLGQGLETNLVSSVLKKGESSLFSSLGNVFGLGGSGTNDGSTANRALYVQFASASPFGASGLDNLPLGSGLGNLFGGANEELDRGNLGSFAIEFQTPQGVANRFPTPLNAPQHGVNVTTISLIFKFMNFIFPQRGKYRFRTYLDDREINCYRFYVLIPADVEASRQAQQARRIGFHS